MLLFVACSDCFISELMLMFHLWELYRDAVIRHGQPADILLHNYIPNLWKIAAEKGPGVASRYAGRQRRESGTLQGILLILAIFRVPWRVPAWGADAGAQRDLVIMPSPARPHKIFRAEVPSPKKLAPKQTSGCSASSPALLPWFGCRLRKASRTRRRQLSKTILGRVEW